MSTTGDRKVGKLTTKRYASHTPYCYTVNVHHAWFAPLCPSCVVCRIIAHNIAASWTGTLLKSTSGPAEKAALRICGRWNLCNRYPEPGCLCEGALHLRAHHSTENLVFCIDFFRCVALLPVNKTVLLQYHSLAAIPPTRSESIVHPRTNCSAEVLGAPTYWQQRDCKTEVFDVAGEYPRLTMN